MICFLGMKCHFHLALIVELLLLAEPWHAPALPTHFLPKMLFWA